MLQCRWMSIYSLHASRHFFIIITEISTEYYTEIKYSDFFFLLVDLSSIYTILVTTMMTPRVGKVLSFEKY